MSDRIKKNFSAELMVLGVALAVTGCTAKIAGPSAADSGSASGFSGTSASPAEATQVLSGMEFWDSTGTKVTGTMALGTDVAGSNAQLSALIPQGYYDGTRSCTMSDTQLSAGNICATKSIFGTAGTAICQSGSTVSGATAADIIAGQEAWNSSGTKLTGTMTNHGNLDVTAAWPGAGYHGASPSGAPGASQLCSGTSVLGVSGSASCGGVILASNQHRDKTTTQISQSTEAVTNAATVYTNADPGYRAIPKISKDDEGYTGGSVTVVDRTGWNTSCDASGVTGAGGLVCKCGLSGTLSQRIADCAAHGTIGPNATWDGATQGNAGQGAWKLVTRTAAVATNRGREVWQDQRTMLLWSSKVSTALNWCKASGSNQISGNPVAEDDPSNYCDLAGTSQNTSGQAISACYEDDGTYFTQTDAGIDLAGKGSLNRTSTPVVGWRLPTKDDYYTAESNGIRFVLPDMVPTTGGEEWAASIKMNTKSSAWLFYGAIGIVTSGLRSGNRSVRCVGR